MKDKIILFIPSNKNHVRIFYSITKYLEGFKILFLTQGTYKNEGVEEELLKLNVKFKKIDEYKNLKPEIILKNENVGVIIIGNDIDIIPQWFVNTAKKIDIPSILIQDGLLFNFKKVIKKKIPIPKKNNFKLLFLETKLILGKKYKKITYGEGGCNQIHVWGKPFEKYILKKGIKKSQIVNTGYLNIQNFEKNTGENSDFILYAPSELVKTGIITSEEMKKNTNIILSTIMSFEKTKVIICPHPIDDSEYYQQFENKFKGRITINKSDYKELLKKCKFLISNLSTTSIEALAIGKPVIIFLPKINEIIESEEIHSELISKKIILYANNEKILHEQINDIIQVRYSLDSKEISNFLNECLGSRDENGLKKSSQEIISLLGS